MDAAEPAASKKQKAAPELTVALADGSPVWSGSRKQFLGADGQVHFARLSVSGKRWIFKSNAGHFLWLDGGKIKALALHRVDEALHLGSTTGIMPATFVLDGQPELFTLEAEVPILPGYKRNPLGKEGTIWDVDKQAKAKAAAVSIADLDFAEDRTRIGSVTTASVQRLGLLLMLGRCACINCDDILLRTADDGGLEVMMGDVKKGFDRRPDEEYQQVWDDDVCNFRPGGPLDEFYEVLDSVQMAMTVSGDEWARWERRPLVDAVAQLIVSWTPEEIDAALDAEESARRDLPPPPEQSGVDASAAAADSASASEWKAQWKEELLLLRQQVQAGRRPSLREISQALGARCAPK